MLTDISNLFMVCGRRDVTDLHIQDARSSICQGNLKRGNDTWAKQVYTNPDFNWFRVQRSTPRLSQQLKAVASSKLVDGTAGTRNWRSDLKAEGVFLRRDGHSYH